VSLYVLANPARIVGMGVKLIQVWRLALFEADQFCQHELSRDHIENFKLDARAGAGVEEFVRLVYQSLTWCTNSYRTIAASLAIALASVWPWQTAPYGKDWGAIANESGVFVRPLDPHRNFLIFGHESSPRS
jgi:hypothetical protein